MAPLRLASFITGLAPFGMAAGALAAPSLDNIDLDAEREVIERYQSVNQTLQDVGWKLVRGNAAFCERTVPSIGLQLQDLNSYGGPDVARAALGIEASFAVQNVARGSPAALVGGFTRNREIIRLAGIDPNGWPAEERMYWQRAARAHDWIDERLKTKGAINIAFANGDIRRLTPVSVCASRFELIGKGKVARANGEIVFFGMDFPGFAYEEHVFAGAVAHELAHNLLGHRAWLTKNGRKRRYVRRAEREADRLIPWLLANAGYDPGAGVTFMETWGPRHAGAFFGLLRSRTHDGWDERAEFIAAELPLIRSLMEREGRADWSVHFERDSLFSEGETVARQP